MQLLKSIYMKKKLVVLTGAGMSAESGIATFRGSDGLWENHRVEDVATPEAWEANPALVQRFYNERRKQLVEVKPNQGHYGLVELEQHYDVQIITQNVDNLHERAGSLNVLHLHGDLMKMRSTGPGEEVFEVDPSQPEYTLEDKCPQGYRLRPHIVWFGEAVPEYENALSIAAQADVMLIIGTSLKVYPAAGLIHFVPQSTPIYIIDPYDVGVGKNIHHIKMGASEGVKEFRKIMKID